MRCRGFAVATGLGLAFGLVLGLGAASGCGGKSAGAGGLTTTTPEPATGSAGVGVVVVVPQCEPAITEPALAAIRARYEIAEDVPLELVACTSGRFGAPGLYLVAQTGAGPPYTEYVAVAGADGALIAARPEPRTVQAQREQAQVVDLDGDGVDEVVVVSEGGAAGILAREVYALVLRGDRLAPTAAVPVAYDDSSTDGTTRISRCSGLLDVMPVAGTSLTELMITVASTEGAPPCLADGTHRLTLQGNALVEVH